ncbi:hypothetical protein DAPPUDRAFT_94926 [Daphnia pulex]|uniref:Uncharacterized protein n=1 Tax=Daphnia pulex TaxID=6669 RepID=E9FTH0_DAPPU|nr:hypothetical protein DAPPUDRAFT_94926 [Daphnia pulex]|eukprot:EFX89636.1 hypothetical protein DAPPUDRAFT_94926 [Daphnia pulex]
MGRERRQLERLPMEARSAGAGAASPRHPAFFSPPSPPVLIRCVSSLAFWDTPTPTAFSNLLMTKWREWREDEPQTSDWWHEDIVASWIDLDYHRSSTLLLANDPFTRIALKFQGIYSDDKTRIAPKPSSVQTVSFRTRKASTRIQQLDDDYNSDQLT